MSRTSPLRVALLTLLLPPLLLLVLAHVPACHAHAHVDAYAEILYVTGCNKTSSPLRHTTGCFAHATTAHVAPHDKNNSSDSSDNSSNSEMASVTLSIAGVHFPLATPSAPLRVCLDEHVAPPLPLSLHHHHSSDNDDDDDADDAEEQALLAATRHVRDGSHSHSHSSSSSGGDTTQAIAATAPRNDCLLECADVTASSLLPTQLLRCRLPHPSTMVRAAHARRRQRSSGSNDNDDYKDGDGDGDGDGAALSAAQRQRVAAAVALLHRMRRAPVWMDVRLQQQQQQHHGGTRHASASQDDDDDDKATMPRYRTVALLRRAVRIDLAASPHAASTTHAARDDDATADDDDDDDSTRRRRGDALLHPLERLYMPSTSTHPSHTYNNNNGNNSNNSSSSSDREAVRDVWFEMGVGGLKAELQTLFRRVFLDRLPSLAALTSQLQVQHVRGVILHGPPGNGKTLIARRLVHLLGSDVRVTLLSATDVLSKYVGESEKNLRDAFLAMHDDDEGDDDEGDDDADDDGENDDADDDDNANASSLRSRSSSRRRRSHRRRHDDNGDSVDDAQATRPRAALHVLVIDELDALFHRRGFSSDESSAKAVYDGVTNTLLSLMDGMHARNDVLVIGLTNRLHALDAALLRPGRFEVVIEIPQPDLAARAEIFLLHTAALRRHHLLADDVDGDVLAQHSDGFSGADVAGTVRAAVSRALLRYRDHLSSATTRREGGSSSKTTTTTSATDGFVVTMRDLQAAMDEVRGTRGDAAAVRTRVPVEPRMGVFASATTTTAAAAGLVDHDGTLTRSVQRVREVMAAVQDSDALTSGVVWVTGARGAGKTHLTQRIVDVAMASATRASAAAATVTTTATNSAPVLRYVACRQLCDMASAYGESGGGGDDYAGEPLAVLRRVLSDASRAAHGVVVLDDADVLFDQLLYGGCGGGGGGNGAAAERAVRNMLYAFVHTEHGVTHTSADAARLLLLHSDATPYTPADTSLLSSSASTTTTRTPAHRRLLVLTSTARDAAPGGVVYDVHVHTHPLHRSSVQYLLTHYGIVHSDHAMSEKKNNSSTIGSRDGARRRMAQTIARHYPVSLSFRSFMRITNMAMSRLAQQQQQAQQQTQTRTQTTTHTQTPRRASATTSSHDARVLHDVLASVADDDVGNTDDNNADARDTAAASRHSGGGDGVRVVDAATARRFAREVDAVVAAMGLTDPFHAWYRDDTGSRGGAENDNKDNNDDDNGDDVDDVDDGVDDDDETAYRSAAAASELLW